MGAPPPRPPLQALLAAPTRTPELSAQLAQEATPRLGVCRISEPRRSGGGRRTQPRIAPGDWICIARGSECLLTSHCGERG
eukprot:5896376-Alexandrium_andersonii.AAC.1